MMLLGAACSSDKAEPVPDLDDQTRIELQARAFARACSEASCDTGSVYASNDVPAELQTALIETVSPQIVFLSQSEIDQKFDTDGTAASSEIFVDPQGVDATSRSDVRGVDVWVASGPGDWSAKTYLFLWDGTAWINTTDDETGVTVTSSVS